MISVRTFLRWELRRLYEWLEARLATTEEPLESVETTQTIGDCIDCDQLSGRLPAGWDVDCEIDQFAGSPPTEVVRLTDREGYRITLKPAELCVPRQRIEIYTRTSPFASRRQRQTVDSLSEARMVTAEIAASRHPTRTRPATQSAATETETEPNTNRST